MKDWNENRNNLYNSCNCVKFPSSVGISPFNLLLERSLFNQIQTVKKKKKKKINFYNVCSCVNFPNSVEIVPFNCLVARPLFKKLLNSHEKKSWEIGKEFFFFC